MACEGGECKVQIFDVRVKKVQIKETWQAGQVEVKDPGESHCKKPTEAQIADALRKKPIWLIEGPNPQKQAKGPCHCIFTEDSLDPKKGWTRWMQQKAPTEKIEIKGTEGPDLPQTATCQYVLRGTYEETSKILHGACMDSSGQDLPQEMKDALNQRNPKEPGQ